MGCLAGELAHILSLTFTVCYHLHILGRVYAGVAVFILVGEEGRKARGQEGRKAGASYTNSMYHMIPFIHGKTKLWSYLLN